MENSDHYGTNYTCMLECPDHENIYPHMWLETMATLKLTAACVAT